MANDITVEIGANTAELKRGLDNALGSLDGFQSKAASMMSKFAAPLAIAGSAMAAYSGIIKPILDDYDRIGDLSNRFDVSAESLQRLGGMAKMSGTDLEAVAKIMQKLIINLNSPGGIESGISDALKELNIDASEFKKLSLEEMIIKLSEAYQNATDKATAYAAIYKVLGKSAGDVMPMLASGSEELKKISDQMSIVSNADIASIQQYNDMIDMMTMKLKALTAQLAVLAGKNGLSIIFGTFGSKVGSDIVNKELADREETKKEEQRKRDAEFFGNVRTWDSSYQGNFKYLNGTDLNEALPIDDITEGILANIRNGVDPARKEMEDALNKFRESKIIKQQEWDIQSMPDPFDTTEQDRINRLNQMKKDATPNIFSSMARIGGESGYFNNLQDTIQRSQLSMLQKIEANTRPKETKNKESDNTAVLG